MNLNKVWQTHLDTVSNCKSRVHAEVGEQRVPKDNPEFD